MTLSDPQPGFQGHCILSYKWNISQMVREFSIVQSTV